MQKNVLPPFGHWLNPPGIRSLRRKLKLSPEEFPAALGFTGKNWRIRVWQWESSNRSPSSHAIILMRELAVRFRSLQRSSRK
jgi:DNA-binding transcriptional regulator YiaG